jgi:hypothetical protein
MTKLNLSLAILLIGTAFVAGNFVACSSNNSTSPTGTGGTGGTTTTGTGGATGGTTATGTGGSGGCVMNMATKTDGSCKCISGAYVRNGACACQDVTPDICPTVGCVDMKHDVANCGKCGMACGATQTCNAGACGAAPTMELAALNGCSAMWLANTGDTVYYAANNNIYKLGTAAALNTGAEMGATYLQVNGANLFWYDTGTKKIRKMAATGGAATDVYTAMAGDVDSGTLPDITGILPDATGANVYFSLGNTVYKQPVAGGNKVTVAVEVHGGLPAALALNGTTNIVYPATFNGDVDAPLLSGNPSICGAPSAADPENADMTTCPRLGRSQGELFPNFVAVVAGHAYWLDGPNVKGEMIGTMGMSFDSITMAQTSKITAAAASTDAIYFSDADPTDSKNGYIEKTALTPNSTATLLARGQNSPISLVVGATKVFWATADCSIQSAAK